VTTVRKKPRTWRAHARAVACPVCNAQPTERCTGERGPRNSCHLERHTRAIEQGAPIAYE